MAGIALPSIGATVHIIRLMTLATLLTFELRKCLVVAAVAGQSSMRARQRKRRLFVVIETPAFPGCWMMATAAVIAELALVCVIGAVAIHAGRCGTCKLGILVTALAGRSGVHAQQGKMRQLMIELDVVVPAGFAVTLLALPTQRFVVHIIRAMTGNAGSVLDRCIHIALVALAALGIHVSTTQRETGFAVIKPALAPAVY